MSRLGADRREWEHLARTDAMWAICSDPARRGAWDEEEFFATGEAEVAGMLGGLEEAGLEVRCGRALDFGCGVGRLTRALARRFDEAVGVDISEVMVARARELNAGFENLRFVANEREDLSVLGEERFDLVVSLIALQHVTSPAVARAYVSELARLTAPGGLLALQLPERVSPRIRLHPLRVLNSSLRALHLPTLTRWSMRVIAVPEAGVRTALEAGGAELATSFSDNKFGTEAVASRMYVARRP